MSSPSPTAHPSLLTSISQMQLVGALLGGLSDFQTDSVFQFALPTQRDLARTLPTFFGGCVGAWVFAFYCHLLALIEGSHWAHKFSDNLIKRGQVGRVVLPLGIFVLSLVLSSFSPSGCIDEHRAALDHVLPPTWEKGTAYVLIEAPCIAMGYLQKALYVLCACLWLGFFLLGLASILLILLAYPVLVITAAWMLIYLDLINSACPRLFSRSRGRYRLRLLYARVAEYHRILDLRAVNRQRLNSLVRQPGPLSTPSIADIGHAYLSLLKNSSTYDYRRCSAYAEWQAERIYSYESNLSLALAAMLDKHFQRGREEILNRSSFVRSAGELAEALDNFRSSSAYTKLASPEEAVIAFLSALETEKEAVQAEEVAFEVILESLFRWKAVKEENKKRLKQD